MTKLVKMNYWFMMLKSNIFHIVIDILEDPNDYEFYR